MKVVDEEVASRILKEVDLSKAFYFFTDIGQYTGVYAKSLNDFCQKIKSVELRSVEFHSSRGDFEKWVREVFGDPYLAEQIGKLSGELKGEELRSGIRQAVEKRVKELKKLLACKNTKIQRL